MTPSGILTDIFVNEEIGQLFKTGQSTSYHAGDDGDLELGKDHDFEVLDTGQFAGTCPIVINGKTHNLSNNCVRDRAAHTAHGDKLMWARYVPTADIGPSNDGKLFWEQWPLGPKTDISFTAGTKIINSVAGNFDVNACPIGRKIAVSGAGEAGNNQTVTVAAITANNMTVEEVLVDEAAGASVSFATVDDLVWDFVDQANANSLGGYTDWRIPSRRELESLFDLENCDPCIDAAVFPSTPIVYHWTSSTYSCHTPYAWDVNFHGGNVANCNKRTKKYYVRLCRGGV